MAGSSSGFTEFDVGIVATTELELAAVLTCYQLDRESGQYVDGREYWFTTQRDANNERLAIAITRLRHQGPIYAALGTAALITSLSPAVMLLVGITAGVKDKIASIGDVVVSRLVV